MSLKRYILKDGAPEEIADLQEWAEWFETSGSRSIDRTEVSPGVVVSTVFLGIDHAFGGGTPMGDDDLWWGAQWLSGTP